MRAVAELAGLMVAIYMMEKVLWTYRAESNRHGSRPDFGLAVHSSHGKQAGHLEYRGV